MKTLIIEPCINGFENKFTLKSVEPDINIIRGISLLKKRYKTDFIDMRTDKIDEVELSNYLKKNKFSFFFIQVKSFNLKNSQRLIDIINKRQPESIIFCFGQHPSAEPKDLLETKKNTMVIKGEIIPFLEKFVKLKEPRKEEIKKLPNLCYLQKNTIKQTKLFEITKMDNLPLIDLDNIMKRDYYTLYLMKDKLIKKWGFISLTKGCRYNCIYCSQTLRISHGKKIMNFTVKEAIKRIKRLLNAGASHIRFLDDNFLCNKYFVRELCQKINKTGLKISWMAQIRADSVDEKTLIEMKKAGCQCLNIGVETGSQKIMRILKKGENVEDIKKCFYLCKKHNIMTVAFFMLGNPKERTSDLAKSKELLKKIRPNMLQIAFFTPYPGSPYYIQNKSLIKNKNIYHYGKLTYNFSDIPKSKLEKTLKSWYISFYLNPKIFLPLFFREALDMFYHPKRQFKIFTTFIKYFSLLSTKNVK
ncbi:MAG: B12-binding domain-containing radical SAM protein [Nanobdellota archaeon]